jgi:hypothetical protein
MIAEAASATSFAYADGASANLFHLLTGAQPFTTLPGILIHIKHHPFVFLKKKRRPQ